MILTEKEWNAAVENKEVEDLSDRLENSFLVFGQWMRALVRYKGKIWLASGWANGRRSTVSLQETKNYEMAPHT